MLQESPYNQTWKQELEWKNTIFPVIICLLMLQLNQMYLQVQIHAEISNHLGYGDSYFLSHILQ